MRKTEHERLFCYEKESEFIPITSCDINNFIKEHLGEDFTAKDLRTYSANKMFKEQLFSFGNPKNEKDALNKIRESIKFTATQLGNTPKVCRDSYIDPILIDKYRKRGLTNHE
jgi:DNA topoisomerase-1